MENTDAIRVGETTAKIVRAYNLFQDGIGLVQESLLDLYGRKDGYAKEYDKFLLTKMEDLYEWFLDLYGVSIAEKVGTLTSPKKSAGGGGNLTIRPRPRGGVQMAAKMSILLCSR